MPDPTNPAAPQFRPVTGLDVAREDFSALAKSIESNAAIHAADERRRMELAEMFRMPPAVDPREVCARTVEKLYRTEPGYGQLDAEAAVRECRRRCAAAIRALPPFAAQQPSEAVRRYDALVDALIRRDENKYVGWGSAGGPIECKHGISVRFHCQHCDYELIQSAIAERRSALAAVKFSGKMGAPERGG